MPTFVGAPFFAGLHNFAHVMSPLAIQPLQLQFDFSQDVKKLFQPLLQEDRQGPQAQAASAHQVRLLRANLQ